MEDVKNEREKTRGMEATIVKEDSSNKRIVIEEERGKKKVSKGIKEYRPENIDFWEGVITDNGRRR